MRYNECTYLQHDPRNKGNMSFGYLELFIGPMFSGKTSKLLEIYKQCIFCNIPVAVINHAEDTRYHDSMLSTHDKTMIPCIQTSHIQDIWVLESENHAKLRASQVILINEAQFFDDLVPMVEEMLRAGKKVYVAGLDGDFQRKRFGTILDLVPLSDKVTKLTSLCSMCKNGENGIFSMRLTQEKQQMLIGSDNYIPVCRGCYYSSCMDASPET